jgi:hypothetical protein
VTVLDPLAPVLPIEVVPEPVLGARAGNVGLLPHKEADRIDGL